MYSKNECKLYIQYDYILEVDHFDISCKNVFTSIFLYRTRSVQLQIWEISPVAAMQAIHLYPHMRSLRITQRVDICCCFLLEKLAMNALPGGQTCHQVINLFYYKQLIDFRSQILQINNEQIYEQHFYKYFIPWCVSQPFG